MLERPMNFNISEYKNFIGVFSDSTIQLNFKKHFGVIKVQKAPFFLKKPKSVEQKFQYSIERTILIKLKKQIFKDEIYKVFDVVKKKLSEKTIKILLPFQTTYLSDAGFSSYASKKTIYYNRLNAEAEYENPPTLY